ncbi:c-type cytochrome [Pseudoduganella sp. DS3]|uniref:C-type cytochrome n=1 Tax=Pseudoduganella guangdongensis TaxID=2692179 RepID=A0A6N9HNS1_9BURK|nr:cytochrome c [Pseudoduganella guangdongensis]MYN05170.1 c-type cytochrome [Pseudoduganella guangdongensis]
MSPSDFDAQQRENPDPTEKDRPIPWFVLAVVGTALAWAVGYILTVRDDDPALGDRRTIETLQAKAGGAAGAAVDGAQVYSAQCVACHQATGAGLPGVFPPLADSEWVVGDEKVAAAILLHGVTGKLTVKGTAYNGQMPAFGEKLGDAEIAAVLSYIRANFGNQAAAVSPAAVKAVRDADAARKEPFNGDEDLAKLAKPAG